MQKNLQSCSGSNSKPPHNSFNLKAPLKSLLIDYCFYFSVLDGNMSDVVQLRHTPPLFKAYEEVYSSLESKYCPSFFKSEDVSTFIIHFVG